MGKLCTRQADAHLGSAHAGSNAENDVISFVCCACGAGCDGRFTQCPACGAIGTVTDADDDDGPSSDDFAPSRAISAHEVELTAPRRCRTGRPAWDTALGGGLVLPSTVLVRGSEGVGKSTGALGVAVHVASALGGCALYASAEMPPALVRQTAERVGVRDLRALYILHGRDAEDVFAAIAWHKPRVVVWDSIQRFELAGELDPVGIVTEAIDDGAEHATLFISQVTKIGEARGSSELGHDVDVVLSLRRAGRRVRVACDRKNRFGATPASALEPLVGRAPARRRRRR